MMAVVISLVVIFPFAASIVETWNLSKEMLQVVGWTGVILLAFGSFYVSNIIFNLMEIDSTNLWCKLFGHKDEDLGEHTRECSDNTEEEYVFHLFRCKRCGVENEGWIWTWRKKGNKEHNLEKQYEKHWYNF